MAYNATPPSDDASETAGNALQWSKHLSKIGNPLKAAIEAINSGNVTAHGRHFGQTFESKSSNYVVQAPGDRGKFFSCTGTITITLPAVDDTDEGFPIVVLNSGTALVTIEGNASELISGETSIELMPESWAILNTDGSSWVILAAEISGTFSSTVTGGTGGSASTFRYRRSGQLVTIHLDDTFNDHTVASNATGLTLPSLPSAIQPPTNMPVVTTCVVIDDGNEELAKAEIEDATITFSIGSPLSATGFDSGGGNKGLPAGWSVTYPIPI